MDWNFSEYTLTDLKGVKAAGVSCGLKEDNKLDLALIVFEKPVSAVAMFTKNTVRAAPVIISQRYLEKYGLIQAVIINSGQANACTGERGLKDAEFMAKEVAKHLGIEKELVFIASTGKIGAYLEKEKISYGIEEAFKRLDKGTGREVAEAIMTTDTSPKITSVKREGAIITGVAKGSGMIHPNMATMLTFIGTNAKLPREELMKALKKTVDISFNQVSIDGCSSTNDTVLLFSTSEEDVPLRLFQKGLNMVSQDLAKKIAKDGEGAKRLINVSVEKAKSFKVAKMLARSVITSNLVKAAFAGGDDNWGRILASMGQTEYPLDLSKIELYLGDFLVFAKNEPLSYNSQEVKKYLKGEEILIRVKLNEGRYKAVSWGCDLTEDYVKINAYYRT